MAKIRQEINIINGAITASSSEIIYLNPTAYSGATYYFEVVGQVASGTATVSLRRSGTTTDDATISVTATSYTRSRVAFSTAPTSAYTYFVYITGGTSPSILSARVVILQSETDAIRYTKSTFEIGNRETGKTNTSSTPLTAPKYWKYVAANWDSGCTFETSIVYGSSSSMYTYTFTLQQDNGSFGSWTDLVTIVNAGTATTPTRVAVAFTPTDGRHYRIAGYSSSSMVTHDVYAAKVTVNVGFIISSNIATTVGGNGEHIARMSSTRVAIFETNNNILSAWSLSDSTWSKTGNNYSISLIRTMKGLSSTRIALIRFNGSDTFLEAYDFNGTDWTLTGNAYNDTYIKGTPYLCKLTSTDIALFDNSSDKLLTYTFNGTDWSQVGNAYSATGVTVSDSGLTALTSTRIVLFDTASTKLKCYDWDGTNWTPQGTNYTVDLTVLLSVAYLEYVAADTIAIAFQYNDTIGIYKYDGTVWTYQYSREIDVTSLHNLAYLSDYNIASFTYYKLFSINIPLITECESSYLIGNGSIGGSTGLKNFDTYYDPAEWDDEAGTTTFYNVGFGAASGTADHKLQSDPNGTPADVTNSTVTDNVEYEVSSAMTMPASASTIDVNVTGTGSLFGNMILVAYNWVATSWTTKNLKAYIGGAWTTKPLKAYISGAWTTKSVKYKP